MIAHMDGAGALGSLVVLVVLIFLCLLVHLLTERPKKGK